MITVIVDETDEQGRTVGQVILPDMSNLNLVILSAGLGWWHGADDPEDQILKDVQSSARSAGRGLWSDPDPVPPWQWRSRPAKPVPSQPVQPAITESLTPALDEAGQ
ncbi:MAG: thermonuclease family protein, partial [bacterium]